MKIDSPTPGQANRSIFYHLNCFKCVACEKILQKGDEFALRGDGIYCKNDLAFTSQQQQQQLLPANARVKNGTKSNGSSNSSYNPGEFANSNTNGSLMFSSSPSSSSSSVSSVSSISSMSNYSTSLLPLGAGNSISGLDSSHLIMSANGVMQHGNMPFNMLNNNSLMHNMNSSSGHSKMNSINTNSNSSFTSIQSKRFF
jgi:hypothetical protein